MMNDSNVIKEKWILLSLVIFSSIFLFFCSMASPFYSVANFTDPYIYFTLGKSWMSGFIPYKDLFDHKGFFIFLIYGIASVIDNDSFTGVYILEVLNLTLILFFIYKIGRLFFDQKYSLLTAILFSIVFFKGIVKGGSAEEFILSSIIIGYYLFFKCFLNKEEPKNIYYLFLQGILLSIVFFSKFNLISFWFFPLLAIFIQMIIDKKYKQFFYSILAVLLGVVVVAFPFVVYFYINDALLDFWQSYIVFNVFVYDSISFDLRILVLSIIDNLKMNTLLFLSALFGLCYFFFDKKYIKDFIFRLSLPLSFAFSYFSIFKGGYVYYYFSPLSVFVLLGIVSLLLILKKYCANISIWSLIVGLFICSVSIIMQNYKMIQNRNSSFYVKEFADYILASTENEKIEILNIGMDEGIYYLTNSLPPNKYFTLPNRINRDTYPAYFDDITETISKEEPPLFILYFRFLYKNNASEKDEKTEQMDALILDKYDLVKVYADENDWVSKEYSLYRKK